jgi:hypothetical protein
MVLWAKYPAVWGEDVKCNNDTTVKDKAIPLVASTGPEDSPSFRLPDFETIGT